MMSQISLVGESSAGGMIVGPGDPTFTVEGKPVSVVGDVVMPHGLSPHNAPVMVQGSSWLTWNGKPVVVSGCMASCGHSADGDGWFELPM